jgi:hypothetical protein
LTEIRPEKKRRRQNTYAAASTIEPRENDAGARKTAAAAAAAPTPPLEKPEADIDNKATYFRATFVNRAKSPLSTFCN